MKTTQKEKVKKYMEDFGSITQLDAFRDLGVMRLSARIWDLKADGVGVYAQQEKSKNRYGETVHYFRYTLAKG